MVDTGLARLGYDNINIGIILGFVFLFSSRLYVSQLKKKFENSTFVTLQMIVGQPMIGTPRYALP